MRVHFLLSALAVTISTCLVSPAVASQGPLQIFYSGNTNGNLKACG